MFTISQVAKKSGLTPRAVRLYEQHGLISSPTRSESGYRTYSENDLQVLYFIHQARQLDLGLEEIKRILDLQKEGETPCNTVLNLVERHIREIDNKIENLRKLRATLARAQTLANNSKVRGEDAVVCRIIESS